MADALHALTVADVVREDRRRFPRQLAVVCGDARLYYPELDARVGRLTNALARLGVGTGDRVVWLGQSCHRVLELLLACSRLGAVAAPVNWRLSADETAAVLVDAAPKVVLFQDVEVGAVLAQARELSGSGAVWVRHDDGPHGYEALLASATDGDDERPVASDAPALMIYTAAFDGRPSGALLGSTSLIGAGLLTALAERLDHRDVFLVSGPLFHIGCWRYVLAMLLMGGTCVVVRRVEPTELCRLVEQERCTRAYLFSATQEQMVEAVAATPYDLTSLRSAPGSPEWNALVQLDDSPWTERPQRYGQTEVGGIVAYGAYGPPPLGGHGRAAPLAQVRILDEEGREVDTGTCGEIAVRGPLVMTGYHGAAPAAEPDDGYAWRRTGDLGRRETDGSITFLGPIQRMIKSGMENVYPVEVEQAIRTHPGVADCAVIGVPDERFIQVVRAIVVPAPGTEPTERELLEHVRERIAHYKAPRSVVLVTSIPRTASGPDYDALDAQHGGGGYPGLGTRTQ